MRNRTVYLYENKKEANGSALGSIEWDPRRGLLYRISQAGLRSEIQRAVKKRVADGRYYVAAAVRSGVRITGLRLAPLRGAVPELLRCIAADEALWSVKHGGILLTPVYRDESLTA